MLACNQRVIRFNLVHSGLTDYKQKFPCLTRVCEIIIKITCYTVNRHAMGECRLLHRNFHHFTQLYMV